MSIKAKCPHCGKEYTLNEKFLNKKAQCKICWNKFIIKEIKINENKKEVENKIEEKKEKKVIEKSPDLNLKPNKISFIFFSNPLAIILTIITIFISFVSFNISIFLFWLTLFLFYWTFVKYKKEKYILTDRKIIYHNWNLISDNSTEIKLDKITEVKASIPFLQKILFNTWNIYIKTAWAWTSKVKLSNINNTMEIYEEFRKRMQKNGFHLKKDKLVQAEKPHILWVLWEIFWKWFNTILVIGYLIYSWTQSPEIQMFYWDTPWMIIWGILLLIVVWNLIFSYLDLRQRKYEIFTDSIWYHEWFLNKHYAFIPMEVVADVENTQSFFSKIFGLHDIVISAAGSSNKVIFKNMTNWETMIKNIRYLKDHIVMTEKEAIEWEEKTANSLIWFKDKIEQPLDFDKEFEGHYKMDIKKTIIESLIFWPLIIIVLPLKLIQLKFTDYNIRKTTIEKKFELFSTKFYSFSIEKITGIQIKQSFIDKWFWTCTIKFWSIGSSHPITFENIKKTKWLEEQVLAKVWIRKEEKAWDLNFKFSFVNFLKANLLISPLLVLLFPITIIIFIYQKFFFDPKRYLREVYKNYIKTKEWIFFVTKKYALFRHIKWVKSTKYPLTNTWKLYLNIAWEVEVQTNKKQQSNLIILILNLLTWNKISSATSILSNSIDMKYIENVFNIHDTFDSILNWNSLNSEKLIKTKESYINTIFPMILLILPIIFIPLAIWIIKVKSWILEKERIIYSSWIIYKRKQSILYNRFNFIDLKRWFLNKIFKNGSVNIYTLWSSWVDMTIKNTKDYNKIYELLKTD